MINDLCKLFILLFSVVMLAVSTIGLLGIYFQQEQIRIITPDAIFEDRGVMIVVDTNGIKYSGEIEKLYKLKEGVTSIIYYNINSLPLGIFKQKWITRIKLCDGECHINYYEEDY